MSVRLISVTDDAENIVSYCARVSNPKNQENFETAPKLLAYCLRNGHYSIFEMANMVLEIETSRSICTQILRHRSFSFQEFSTRYAEAENFIRREARRQDTKNRQNSIDDLSEEVKRWYSIAQEGIWQQAYDLYKVGLEKGIAKECMRELLPLNTRTKVYMNGTIRSWIHYIQLRTDPSTQLEHRMIAEECKKIFCEQLPSVAKALGWV